MTARSRLPLGVAIALAVLGLSPSMAQGAPAMPEQRVRYSFPAVGDYRVLVGDFHMHTKHSDGVLTPQERVRECYLAGYDAIAITDHGTSAAYPEAKPVADELGVILIRGLESGVNKEEHFVVLGVSPAYKPLDSHNWAPTPEQAKETGRAYYRDQLRAIADTGGCVIYAHPNWGFREPVLWAREQGILVGVEVLNSCTTEGWGTVMSHGRPCYPFAFDWALKVGVGVYSNSDIHERQTECAPRGRTLLLTKEASPEGVMDAIRSARVLAWFPDGGTRWKSDEMLWAPPEHARAYVAAAAQVEVRQARSDPNKLATAIRNTGSVRLHARVSIEGELLGEAWLGLDQEYVVEHLERAGQLRVEWANVYVSPTTTLLTSYAHASVGAEVMSVAAGSVAS